MVDLQRDWGAPPDPELEHGDPDECALVSFWANAVALSILAIAALVAMAARGYF